MQIFTNIIHYVVITGNDEAILLGNSLWSNKIIRHESDFILESIAADLVKHKDWDNISKLEKLNKLKR